MNFAEKLDRLITLSGVNNVKIGKALSIDASLVSKWRCGARNPLKNIDNTVALAHFLAEKITTEYQIKQLAELSQMAAEQLQEQTTREDALVQWFYQEDDSALTAGGVFEPAEHDGANWAVIDRSRSLTVALGDLFSFLEQGEQMLDLWLYYDDGAELAGRFRDSLLAMKQKKPHLLDRLQHVFILVPTLLPSAELKTLIDIYNLLVIHNMPEVFFLPQVRHRLYGHLLLALPPEMALTHSDVCGTKSESNSLITDRLLVGQVVARLRQISQEGVPFFVMRRNVSLWECLERMADLMQVWEDIMVLGNMVSPFIIPTPLLIELMMKQEPIPANHQRADIQQTYNAAFLKFLEHNQCLYALTLFSPEEVGQGAVTVPHLPRFGQQEPMITPYMYYEILKYVEHLNLTQQNFVFYVTKEQTYNFSLIIQNRHTYYATKNEPLNQTSYSDEASFVEQIYNVVLRENYLALSQARRERAYNLQLLRRQIHLFEEKLGIAQAHDG